MGPTTEILIGLLIGTAVSDVVPLINAELLVAGVVVAAPHVGVPAIALVAAAGQMFTKTAPEELVVMTRDRDMLEAFVARAWEPDLAAARRATPVSSRGTRLGDVAVRLGSCLASALG